MEESKIRCPYCRELILEGAIKCRYCGTMLTDAPPSSGAIGGITLVKQALAGRYEIQEEIGRGGMATVYRAVQKNLNRPVALKVIHQNLVHDTEFVARFHREAQVCASLQHPNIVTVYDEGELGGVHFMAMELLDGHDLHRIIRQQGQLSVEQTLIWLAPIAEALQYAHSRGIIHRDIKSSNILITQSGRTVLMDFGIAHAASGTRLTQTGLVIGTPEYMSPEQAEGRSIDQRTDIYSLGIVLYECLTGKVPFKADNPLSIIMKVVNEEPVPPFQLNEKVPDWLNKLVLISINKDVNKRYAHAAEFATAFLEPSQGTRSNTKKKPRQIPDNRLTEKKREKYNYSPQSGKEESTNKPLKVFLSLLALTFLALSILYLHNQISFRIAENFSRIILNLNAEDSSHGLRFSFAHIESKPLQNKVFIERLKIEPVGYVGLIAFNQIEISYPTSELINLIRFDQHSIIRKFTIQSLMNEFYDGELTINLGKIKIEYDGAVTMDYFDEPMYLPFEDQRVSVSLSDISILLPEGQEGLSNVIYNRNFYDLITHFDHLNVQIDYLPALKGVKMKAGLSNRAFTFEQNYDLTLKTLNIQALFDDPDRIYIGEMSTKGLFILHTNTIQLGDLNQNFTWALNNARIDYSMHTHDFESLDKTGLSVGVGGEWGVSLHGLSCNISNDYFHQWQQEVPVASVLQKFNIDNLNSRMTYKADGDGGVFELREFNLFSTLMNATANGLIKQSYHPEGYMVESGYDFNLDFSNVHGDLKPFLDFIIDEIPIKYSVVGNMKDYTGIRVKITETHNELPSISYQFY